MTVSAFIWQVVREHIEDELDRKALDEAIAEYEKDPVTYSLEEVESMLGL